MKRPLFLTGILFLLCTALSMALSRPWGAAFGFAVLFVLLLCGEKRRSAALAAAAALLLSQLAVAVYDTRLSRMEAMAGQRYHFIGYVSRLSESAANSYALAAEVGGISCEVWLADDCGALPRAIGDWAAGELTVAGVRPSPRGYFLSGGLMLSGEAAQVAAAEAPGWHTPRLLLRRMTMLRARALSALQAHRSDNAAAVVSGLLFSDSIELRAQQGRSLTAGGSAHYLTVSGFQMAVALGLLLGASKRRFGRALMLALGLAVIFLLSAAGGFSPTVLRAALMQSLALLANALGRRSDAPTSLALSASVICAASPALAADAGFWMMFSAVLGIALLAAPLRERLRNVVTARRGGVGTFADKLLFCVSVVAAAQLALLPAYAAAYGYIAPYALLSNLLLYPLVLLMLLPGAGAVFCFLAGLPAAGGFLLDAACLPAKAFLSVSERVSKLPFALLRTPLPLHRLLVFLLTALLIAAVLLQKPAARVRWLRAGAVLCAAVLLAASVVTGRQTLLLSDPESGAALLVQGDRCVVIDGSAGGYTAERADAFLQISAPDTALAVLRPPYANLTRDIALCRRYAPRALFTVQENAAVAGLLLPEGCAAAVLSDAPSELTGWLTLDAPNPYITRIRCGERIVLKLWAGYGIIQADDLPPDADLLIDVAGRVYSMGDLRVRRDLSGAFRASIG